MPEIRFANYCEACAFFASKGRAAGENPAEALHVAYHDSEYGFPLPTDAELFGRLILEINQAGLSWGTILRKKDKFKAAYDNFKIEKIAAYAEQDRLRLLSDPGIIRNRLKIDAAIVNAGRILALQASHGSFKQWLDDNHPLEKADWVKLFKKTFLFTGGEITGEFLMSTGYLPGAHVPTCPVHEKVVKAGAPWSCRPNG